MSSARERILDRIRKASSSLRERAAEPTREIDVAHGRQVKIGEYGALLALAKLSIEELGDTLVICGGIAEARDWIKRDLDTAGLSHGVADPEALSLLGIAPGGALGGSRLEDATAREAVMAAQFGIGLVDRMAAEMGTLAFAAGPGRARLTSLAPDVHYALVPGTNLVPDLVDLLAWQGGVSGRTITWITGSSRTGDIDGELIHGAHGPARLVVLIVGAD